MNYSLLAATPLFRGITQTEIESMLICLNAREREYPKDTAILRAGDTTHELGLVLAGSVSIESDKRMKRNCRKVQTGRTIG